MPATPKQIIIRGNVPEIKEGIATESITPGDLLDFVTGSAATAGTYLTPYVKKHAISGGRASKMFALEQDYIGTLGGGGSTAPIDKTYANNDQVRYGVFQSGHEVYARLAASENVSFGTYLMSNGDGTLKVSAGGSAGDASIVARSLGISNVGSVARLIVEVL